jgi:hypothetical protein
MTRQIMIPTKDNSMFSIPSEYYGMKVEVLVFPFHDKKEKIQSDSINDIFDKHLYSFGSFTFNRDEANDYE